MTSNASHAAEPPPRFSTPLRQQYSTARSERISFMESESAEFREMRMLEIIGSVLIGWIERYRIRKMQRLFQKRPNNGHESAAQSKTPRQAKYTSPLEAASAIAAVWRGYVVRMVIRRLHGFATRIQCCWRCHAARRSAAALARNGVAAPASRALMGRSGIAATAAVVAGSPSLRRRGTNRGEKATKLAASQAKRAHGGDRNHPNSSNNNARGPRGDSGRAAAEGRLCDGAQHLAESNRTAAVQKPVQHNTRRRAPESSTELIRAIARKRAVVAKYTSQLRNPRIAPPETLVEKSRSFREAGGLPSSKLPLLALKSPLDYDGE